MFVESAPNKIDFQGVIRVETYRNGYRVLRENNIDKDIKALQSLLTGKADGNQEIIRLKTLFKKFIPDFKFEYDKTGKIDLGKTLRHYIAEEENAGYLFTGKEVLELDTLGRTIGPEKHYSLQKQKTAKSYEAMKLAKNYFERAKEIIQTKKSRVKKTFDQIKQQYSGNEITLKLHLEEGKDGKLKVKNLEFAELIAENATKKKKASARIKTVHKNQPPVTSTEGAGKRKSTDTQLKLSI